MRTRSLIWLVVMVVVILALAAGTAQPIFRNINYGLDLRGGVQVVIQAVGTKESPLNDASMDSLLSVMRERVDELGVSEPIIQRQGDDRLIVEIAGVKDPEEAVKAIGQTAMLQFKTADGKLVLTGKDLKDAKAVYDQTNQPEISLEFNSAGAKAFADVTRELVQKYPNPNDPNRAIAIYLDEELLTNPLVKEEIADGKAVISGSYTFDEAARISALLRGGALPLDVNIIAKTSVGPTLGADSLDKSKTAIMVALLAILAFMLIVYKVPGFVAGISLAAYAMILLGALLGMNAVLSLPGIAGLLLSVGMAVDSNIIIYERVKDELRNGKTLRASVEAGFNRALWTILDSNITTLFGASVLYFYGTGPIRGFAVTLGLGILASMLTAIVLTRYLLRLMVNSKLFVNLKLYGA
ncbi:MAG: protein translocase subunit SecD [Bacillota bacterium]